MTKMPPRRAHPFDFAPRDTTPASSDPTNFSATISCASHFTASRRSRKSTLTRFMLVCFESRPPCALPRRGLLAPPHAVSLSPPCTEAADADEVPGGGCDSKVGENAVCVEARCCTSLTRSKPFPVRATRQSIGAARDDDGGRRRHAACDATAHEPQSGMRRRADPPAPHADATDRPRRRESAPQRERLFDDVRRTREPSSGQHTRAARSAGGAPVAHRRDAVLVITPTHRLVTRPRIWQRQQAQQQAEQPWQCTWSSVVAGSRWVRRAFFFLACLDCSIYVCVCVYQKPPVSLK